MMLVLFLENLKKSKGNVLGVLCSKPYFSIETELNKSCKGKECFFIDTVSESKGENILFVDPSNLTGLSIAINQSLQSLGGKTFIIFDSLTNLSIRNDPEILAKFMMFILTKSKDWKSEVIVILSEGSLNERLVSIIKQTADKVEIKR